ANLILPAQGWSEKSGTVTNSERRISRQRRVMPSPGQAKPDWWIICQVANKMGFGHAFDYRHEGEIFKEYANMTCLKNETGQRDLNLKGLTQLSDKAYANMSPQQWPVLDYQNELVHQRLFEKGQFFTPSQKANFVAISHQTPKSAQDEGLPLLLNTGRARDHWHTMTRTGLSVSLTEHALEPYCEINPQTAHTYGLENDDLAWLSNAQGQCLVRVKITSKQAAQQVFMPIHWNSQTASQADVCQLIRAHTDAYSGQPEFKHTPIRIEKYAYQSHGMVLSPHPIQLDGVDYWVKQKVAGGYLYQFASGLTTAQLALHMKALLWPNERDGCLLEMTVDNQYQQFAQVHEQQLKHWLIVQDTSIALNRERIKSQLNQVWDEQEFFEFAQQQLALQTQQNTCVI
ncbi:MAG: molybdopterin oxidoreductase family protein, partial [Vibrio sp.]